MAPGLGFEKSCALWAKAVAMVIMAARKKRVNQIARRNFMFAKEFDIFQLEDEESSSESEENEVSF